MSVCHACSKSTSKLRIFVWSIFILIIREIKILHTKILSLPVLFEQVYMYHVCFLCLLVCCKYTTYSRFCPNVKYGDSYSETSVSWLLGKKAVLHANTAFMFQVSHSNILLADFKFHWSSVTRSERTTCRMIWKMWIRSTKPVANGSGHSFVAAVIIKKYQTVEMAHSIQWNFLHRSEKQ